MIQSSGIITIQTAAWHAARIIHTANVPSVSLVSAGIVDYLEPPSCTDEDLGFLWSMNSCVDRAHDLSIVPRAELTVISRVHSHEIVLIRSVIHICCTHH